MSSIFRFVMAGLGVMEFVNAAMCWTSQTEVYTANVFIGNGLPFYDPIIPHLMAVYSWALIGLGSIRLAAAFEPKNHGIHKLNLLVHIFECFFWWHEVMQQNVSHEIYKIQGYSVVQTKSRLMNVVSSIATPITSKGEVLPSDPLPTILLLGLPLLIVLILMNKPAKADTGKKAKVS